MFQLLMFQLLYITTHISDLPNIDYLSFCVISSHMNLQKDYISYVINGTYAQCQ